MSGFFACRSPNWGVGGQYEQYVLYNLYKLIAFLVSLFLTPINRALCNLFVEALNGMGDLLYRV